MKRYALALATLVTLIVPAKAQYYPPYGNGPDPREWGPDEQRRYMPPWPRRGPQVIPCIFEGDCRGPRYHRGEGPYPLPPFPPRERRWVEEDD